MAAIETASLPWPPSLPELKRLDTLLRCGICYEFLNTAMVTACSHNYCSLCIRQYLTYKTQCPACFKETTGQQLRNNRLLDEVIGLFPALRDKVARNFQTSKGSTINGYLAKKEINSNSNECNNHSENIEPCFDENLEIKSPEASTSNRLITKNESIRMEKLSPSTPVKSQKNSFFSPRSSKSHYNFLNLKSLSGSQSSSSSSRSENNLEVPMRSSQTSSFSSPKQSMPPNQSVAGHFSIQRSPCVKGNLSEPTANCPVCGVTVPERNINLHLDACLKRTEKENTLQVKKPSDQRRPNMAKLVYSLLNDKQLRQKLKEVGLNNQGDKQTLIRRHQKYTVLYNAECDLENPRPLSELVRQVEREEKDLKGIMQQKTIFGYDRKSAPEVIEKEQIKYVKNNSNHFANLIADVKKRREEAKKNKEKKNEGELNTSGSGCNQHSTTIPLNNRNINSDVKHKSIDGKGNILFIKSPIKSIATSPFKSADKNLKERNNKEINSANKKKTIEDESLKEIQIFNDEELMILDETQPMEDLSDLEELDETLGTTKNTEKAVTTTPDFFPSSPENSGADSSVHSECSDESNDSFSLLQEYETQEQELEQISSPDKGSSPVFTSKQEDSDSDATEENVRRSSRNSNKRTIKSIAQDKELLDSLGPETQMLSDDDEHCQEQELEQISSPAKGSSPVFTSKQEDSDSDATEENVRRSSRNSNKRTIKSIAQDKELLDALGPETQMLSDDDELCQDFDYKPTEDLDDDDFTGFSKSRSLRSKRQKRDKEFIMLPPLKKVVRKKRK